MDVHHNNEELPVEDVTVSTEESVPAATEKEKKKRRPMALWQKIAAGVSAGVCLVAIAVATYLCLMGKPLSFSDVNTYFRLAQFAAVTLSALGGTLLFNVILTLRWRAVWRVLLGVFGAILLVLGLIMGTWQWWLPNLVVKPMVDENIQVEEQPKEEDVAITPDLPPVRNVMNIALFGIDQKKGSVGRSDALMIVSIDKDHNKIKLTSIARDSLVPIDGHGEEKITHAWAYGHAPLALKTLNQNFGMNITEYAYINLEEFIDAIDYMGGVYVDVNAAERDHLNQWEFTHECKVRYGGPQPFMEKTGRQLLNGILALAYARNRTDGDSNRTARQREVLMSMYEQIKTQPISKLPGTISQMLRLCHSSLSGSEVTEIATWALTNAPTVETLSLPNAQIPTWNGVLDKQHGWVRVFDLDAATQVLHNFVYETDQPITDVTTFVPSTTVAEDEKKKTTAVGN